ncbi:MAG: Co2+/Mg2+ efflux protein ApaG [Saprospiraceae bacterium]
MEICTTNGITVRVETQYLPAHSNARAKKFLFGYHITIENGSPFTVQLLSRVWDIWDSNGIRRKVEGEGVVGQQPMLAPGEVHSYSSYCNLMTEIGKMSGAYLMVREHDQAEFYARIPEFQLVVPHIKN